VDYYEDPERYQAEYAGLAADIEGYRARARNEGGRVLELGCGTGRVLLPLARAAIAIDGLDASPAMLDALRRNRPPPETRLFLADMRDFSLGRRYRLVIAPLNALMHLLDDADVLASLRSIRRHLEPGGRLLFDVHNPIPELLRPSPPQGTLVRNLCLRGAWFAQREFFSYDGERRIGDIEYRFEPLSGTGAFSVRLRLRYFPPAELDRLLSAAGFSVLRRDGGFGGEPFRAESMTQFVEAAPGNPEPSE